jgi:hypothetical protein
VGGTFGASEALRVRVGGNLGRFYLVRVRTNPHTFLRQNRLRTVPHSVWKPHKSAQVFLLPITIKFHFYIDYTMRFV